ncbi:response regulator transcription factor [Pseudonocardia lutea]|uniref:Response regulator transcription factor n=1 Tax=Pseudonocardia lutea TaxID=2172015 RepID=A0ABW1IB08_9PSEU
MSTLEDDTPPGIGLGTPIRVVIVSAQPLIRGGLRHALRDAEDVRIVGEAEKPLDAVHQVGRLRPDVVVLDVGPNAAGRMSSRLVDEVHRAGPPCRVLAIADGQTRSALAGLIRSGVAGVLSRDGDPAELPSAIGAVHRGDAVFRLHYGEPTARRRATQSGAGGAARLTAREREVLQLLVTGRTNREIALALHVSETTAKFHVRSLMTKFGATRRTEVVWLATQHGLL